MATWITHFRIAEAVLARGCDLDPTAFLLGNVGPDSGIPNADWSAFDPPKRITHFHNAAGEISPDRFYELHLTAPDRTDASERAFLLGYHAHLFTDVLFLRLIWHARRITPLYAEALSKDGGMKLIRRDWWGLDFLYLTHHPECMFFSHILPVTTVPDYLNIFHPGSFTKQIQHIQQFYTTEQPNIEREYIYLALSDVEAFVETVVVEIEREWDKKSRFTPKV